MMESITFPWSKPGGADSAVPVRLPLTGRTGSSACSEPLGPIHGPGNYVRGTSACLSSLLAAGRHEEILEVMALQRFPFWHDREFGMQALAYTEASRGLSMANCRIGLNTMFGKSEWAR